VATSRIICKSKKCVMWVHELAGTLLDRAAKQPHTGPRPPRGDSSLPLPGGLGDGSGEGGLLQYRQRAPHRRPPWVHKSSRLSLHRARKLAPGVERFWGGGRGAAQFLRTASSPGQAYFEPGVRVDTHLAEAKPPPQPMSYTPVYKQSPTMSKPMGIFDPTPTYKQPPHINNPQS